MDMSPVSPPRLPMYQSPARSNKRKRSDNDEEVGAAVAATSPSSNHDFGNLSESMHQSPGIMNKRKRHDDEEEVGDIAASTTPSNKGHLGNLSESALREMLVKAIDEEPDINTRRKKFKSLSTLFAKKYNDSFANESKNDNFRPGFRGKKKKFKSRKVGPSEAEIRGKKTYFKWWYYEIPSEERVKELESMHNLMMCEVFLRLGITHEQLAVARSVYNKYNNVRRGKYRKKQGQSSFTMRKVSSKQLSNSMFGIETIPKVSLAKHLTGILAGVLKDAPAYGLNKRYRDEKGKLVWKVSKGPRPNASNGQTDAAHDSSSGGEGLKEVPKRNYLQFLTKIPKLSDSTAVSNAVEYLRTKYFKDVATENDLHIGNVSAFFSNNTNASTGDNDAGLPVINDDEDEDYNDVDNSDEDDQQPTGENDDTYGEERDDDNDEVLQDDPPSTPGIAMRQLSTLVTGSASRGDDHSTDTYRAAQSNLNSRYTRV